MGGIHLGLSTLYHSAQFTRPGILFKGYIPLCTYLSHLHLCATQIMSVDTWRRMWLFLKQSLGRQKPQVKVLLTWWCQLCCICSISWATFGATPPCISGCDPTLFWCRLQQQKLLENKKYIMVEFLMGQEWRNLGLPKKPVGSHEACFLMNLYLWMFFFLASNKMSAQLKLFLSLWWYQKVRELCGFLSLMEEVCCCDLSQWGVFS